MRMAKPKLSETTTRIGAVTFGRRCRKITLAGLAPIVFAAVM